MNKTTFVIVVLAAVALGLGIAVFMLVAQKAAENEVTPTPTIAVTAAATTTEITTEPTSTTTVQATTTTAAAATGTPANKQTFNLTKTDSGKIIQVAKGDKVIVKLDNPGDGGYVFADPVLSSTSVKLSSHVHTNPTVTGVVGDFGTDTWTFTAQSAGTCKITINIYQPWDKAGSLTKDFAVTLVVK